MYTRIRNIQNRNKKIINEAKGISFKTRESREKSIVKLKKILKETEYLDQSTEIKILSQLSTMYLINSDYENGLEYAIEVIYLSEKFGDTFTEAKSLIDMANVFTELDQYSISEDIIKHALSLEIENEYNNALIKHYGYMNLADIFSKDYRSEEAMEYVDKALEYLDKESSEYASGILIISLIRARIALYEGDIEQCRKILWEIESREGKFEGKMVINVEIPLLLLKAKVQIYDGNIEKGMEMANKVFELCDREGLTDNKKRNIDYISKELHKYYDETELKKMDIYEHKILEKYEEIIKDRNKVLAKFMIGRCEYKFKDMEAKEDRTKVTIQAVIISTMVLLLIAVAIYARRYKMQTQIDGLTNVFNRRKFDYDYKKALVKKERLGLIILDVDHFKSLNDNYGHAFGDVVLKNVVKVMKNRLSKDETLYRYGGEEFCILCKNKALEDVVRSAESIRKEVESMVWREPIEVTISLGVSCRSQDADVFKLADENLYKSKKNGRNRVTYKE